MTDFVIKEGQCFLRKNWKATAENKQPTTKGNFMLDGVEYEIALWPSKSGKEGSLSGKINKAKIQNQKQHEDVKVEDDEIPFN